MTFQQLEYGLETARCTSINKAAEKLYTHQSNLSNIIKQLEDELGIQIFERNKKGVTLTEPGREFLSYAEDIVKRKEFVEDLYSVRDKFNRVYLNVSSMRAFFMSVPVIKIQTALTERAEQSVYLRMKKQSFAEVLTDVGSGMSELGIVFVLKENSKRLRQQCSARGLECCRLGESHMNIVVRSDHPVLKTAFPLEHITEYSYAICEEEENFGAFYDESSRSLSQMFQNPPKCILSSNDSIFVNDVIGDTDAFFISTTPWQHSEHSDFVSIPLPGDDNVLEHYYVKIKDHDLSYLAHIFEQELSEMFRDASLLMNG